MFTLQQNQTSEHVEQKNKNFPNLSLPHIHSSRMESRGTDSGVATERSSFARLYLVCLAFRQNGGRGWRSDERRMEAPERAMFAATFASLPCVVYFILLAGHQGWTHSIAPCSRTIRSFPLTILQARWRMSLEKQYGQVFEELNSLTIATFP